MRTRKLTAFLIVMCCVILTLSSTALASATQTAKTAITVPVADAKEVIADNAALVAENGELKSSLAIERQNSKDLMAKMDEYIVKSEQEMQLLKEQNSILQEQVVALNKKIKIEHAKGFMQGVPVGAVIGVLIAIIL